MMLVAMIILFRIFLFIALLIGLSNSDIGSSIKLDTLTRCLVGCLVATYVGSEFLVLWLKNDEV